MKETKGGMVKKKVNHDSMWIKGSFRASSGHFKFTITRYDTTLTLALGKNDHESKIMMKVFNDWIKKHSSKSYGDMFNKLEKLCELSKNGYELIDFMNGTKIQYYAKTTKSN